MNSSRSLRCLMGLVLVLLLTTACERDHLYFGNKDMAIVQLNIDWDSCRLRPNGATVLAYHEDGTLYTHYAPFSDPNTAQIALPPGRYNLIVYNNTPEEYEGMIALRGEENWSTYEAYSYLDSLTSPIRRIDHSEQEQYYAASEPDTLAVARYMNLLVTADMVSYYWDVPGQRTTGNEARITDIEVSPQRVVYEVALRVHLTGLKYSRGRVHAYMRGLAGGYYLGRNRTTDQAVSHEFWLNNRTYDEGSTTDGTVSASFLSFGARPGVNNQYYVDLEFELINGESYKESIDVSEQVLAHVESGLDLNLNVEMEVNLPEVIGTEEGGGFQTGLNEWGDIEENIEM